MAGTGRRMAAFLIPLAVAVAAILAAGVLAPASAQPASILGLQEPAPDEPLHLNADQLSYTRTGRIAIASGNVEIQYGNYTVFADRVAYNRDTGTLIATGNVRLVEPSGNVVEAEFVELSNKFREGFVRQLTLLMTNDARLHARSAERHEGNVTILNDATYTACKACAKHPERPLVWQIKAKRVIHDKEARTIYYENAALEFFGVPVVRVPRFSHPDPTVRRKSGFLMPSFSASDEFGFGVEVPYFFNLAPNYDFTFSPLLTTEQGPVWKGQWRHALRNGNYSVTPTGVYQLEKKESPGDTRWRGSVHTRGDFQIARNWSTGWDATVTSDDTYMRRYNIDERTDLTSQVYLTGLNDRNYFDARAYHFRGLLLTDDNDTTPYVLPNVDHNYLFQDTVLGGELGIDSSFMSLYRDTGADSTRLVTQAHWQRPLVNGLGQVITPFVRMRGDFYVVDDVPNPVPPGGKRGMETVARFLPAAGVDLRMPLVNRTPVGNHILEPVLQVIARPDETDTGEIPNEDSLSFEFDAVNLFSIDKFSGYDRWEGGVRANLGFNYTLNLNNGATARVGFGESFHIAGRNSFGAGTGLESDRSDFVGSVYVLLNQHLSASARFRLDEETLEFRSNEIGGRASYGRLTAVVNYTDQDPIPAFGLPTHEEEIVLNGSFRITDRWTAFGGIRYDIQGERTTTDSIGLGYEDECFGFRVHYFENFTEDRDVDPERALMLRFNLKTIGSAGFKTGLQ